jgi:hypothetical protein
MTTTNTTQHSLQKAVREIIREETADYTRSEVTKWLDDLARHRCFSGRSS